MIIRWDRDWVRRLSVYSVAGPTDFGQSLVAGQRHQPGGNCRIARTCRQARCCSRERRKPAKDLRLACLGKRCRENKASKETDLFCHGDRPTHAAAALPLS